MLALVFCLPLGVAHAQPTLGERPTSGAQPSDAESRITASPNAPSTSRPRTGDGAEPADSSTVYQAQPANGPKTTAPPAAATGAEVRSDNGRSDAVRPPAIEEVRPEVMYLRDKSGRLVPAPGFSYEDFRELLRLRQQLDEPAAKVPDYSLQQLLISGEADGKFARLTARFDIQVRRPDWVRVPLGLGGAALASPADYEGRGDYFVDYEEDAQQYVVWLRGSAGAAHRLTLALRAPLATVGMQHKLSLSVARSATSKLAIEVPGQQVVASAVPAELVPEVTHGENSSHISLLGVGGDVTLTWSESARSAAQTDPVLESSGLVVVRIDGRSLASDATLSVRSFGAAFDRFRVRLPKGAVLSGGEQPGYTLTAVGAGGSSLVEVKLDKPTTGPVDVNLLSERTFDLTRPETLELAGFEVIEAVPHRQGGQIGVVVTGDWQVVWEGRSRVRQIDEPAEALRRRDLLAAFEYVGQPCSLTARVVPRQPRITVAPEFVYYVDADQTRLEARLKYSIRGAKVFSLDLDIPGWQVDEVGPASVVDLKSMVTGEDARLKLPFLQPMVGDVEIALRAHRSHATNPGDIELRLPVLKDAAVGPATVAIVPDDNVELTTRTGQLVALSPQRAPPTLALPPRRQDPLIFRGERANAKYVAGLAVHPQKIAVQVASVADVEREGIEVEQRFQYQVFYEPVERLSFAMPASLATQDGIALFVDDEPVVPRLIADDSPDNQNVRIQVTLPAPRIGLVEVVSRYRLPFAEVRPATTIPVDLPLVMPLEGEFGENSLTVTCATGFAAALRLGHWKRVERDSATNSRRLRLTSASAASSAGLSVLVEERPVTGAVVIQRAWVQTWVSDRSRQERAVFRITAAQPRISLNLPANVNASEVEALLDAQPIRPTLENGNTVVVDWPGEGATHTLELRYAYADGGRWSVGLTAPEFGSGVRLPRMYWQLIVPHDQHLVSSDSSLTPEFTWLWDRLHWSRANRLDQAELEDWTQTLHDPVAPDSMNVYLFSVVGNGGALDVWIARRSTLVFVASSSVLAIVLLAIYVPVLRRPKSLLAVGIVLCVLALAYPEPAIVFAQAALVGVGLSMVAAVMHRIVPRERNSKDVPPVPQESVVDRKSTDVFHRPAPVVVGSSTATRALAIERSSSESQVR